jgi:O-antigen biosynthesis protein
MSEILLSAIVSTYAAEHFIRGCLDDLLAQTMAGEMEIIVVDAASPQNEGAVVEEYARRHPNIRYVLTPEREPLYASWNRGIAMARGKYVTSANTDDRHRRDGLRILVDALENDPGAALAYGDVIVTCHDNARFDDEPPYVTFRWPDFDRRLLFAVAYCGPQPVWRRELHDRYGWFDADLTVAGDYEWWLRLATNERFVHVPELCGLYLSSSASIEHRHAGRSRRQSEEARTRHWSASWGNRPRPGGLLLRFDFRLIARDAMRGKLRPLRDSAALGWSMIEGKRHHS